MTNNWTNLHSHTEYSLLDGLSHPADLVKKAKEQGMSALAISDHGNMAGAIEHYKACKEHEIKPIIGNELYISPRGRTDKEKEDRQYFHLIALATNEVGYKNLLKLTTIGNLEGYYYKPRVDHAALEQYKEGLIILSGCASSEVAEAIRADDFDKALKIASYYRDVFGPDNYYMELQDHGIDFQPVINRGVIDIARKLDLRLVCTQDNHYTCSTDHDAHDLLLAVQTGAKLSDEKRFHFSSEEHYLKSPDEMAVLFGEVKGALSNTMEIAEKCNLEIQFGRLNFPRLPFVPQDKTPDEFLSELCWSGIYKQYGAVTEVEASRLKYELEVVNTTGYAPYILFVWDFVREARSRNILCGPRGSAAGSIILYCLDITTLDPISNGLTFERFLNPERIQMPDIDMDFADTRRGEIIQYVTELYGRDHVAQILTINKMMARAAIKDTGRALEYSISDVEKVSKLIPTIPVGMTIDKSLDAVPELKRLYETDPDSRILIDRAKTIEGTARNTGVNAAGIVVSDEPLIEYTPLQHGSRSDDTIVTQYEMHALEDIGLLKMDFLGLANLSIIELALKLIEKRRGINLELRDIPDNDKATYTMLSRGDSVGVFQMESAGMRRVLMQFKPESIQHLAAIVALYRPGPMDQIPKYIEAKNDSSKISYIHPKLEPILNDTYSVLVYQDQVLRVLQDIAGYSLGQADIVRKAMGKKIRSEMEKEQNIFLSRAKEKNIDDNIAKSIWELIEPFAGYGFNKCTSGKTVVYRGGSSQFGGSDITVEELFERLYGNKREHHSWRSKFHRNGGIYLRSMIDNRIKLGKCVDVHCNGIKPVYRVLLENGMYIDATENHRHMTSLGWCEVKDLSIGDLITVQTEYEKYYYEKIGYGSGWAGTEYKKGNKIAIDGRNRSYSHGNSTSLNLVTLDLPDYCENCQSREGRLERAHLDNDRTNNSRSNVKMLCNSCHKKQDYSTGSRKKRFSKGYPVDYSEIVSIEYVGEEMTYDIEMENEEHNFVANGIVTHNSHAMCYGNISYQTAYLKCNYPVEYMTAMLTVESGNTDKVIAAVGECRKLGIKVLIPDINKSNVEFSVIEDNEILYGFGAIKDVGGASAPLIVSERDKNGQYTSLDDMCDRLNLKTVNKGVMTNLIKSGSMNEFGTKQQLLDAIEKSLKLGRKNQTAEAAGQISMFGLEDIGGGIILNNVPEPTKDILSVWEKESLGFFLQDHPFEVAEQYLRNTVTAYTSDLSEMEDKDSVVVAGVLTEVKNITTKKGDAMCVARVEDLHGTADVVVFPRQYKGTSKAWQEDNIVIINGHVSFRDEAVQIIADSIKRWELQDKVEELPRNILSNSTVLDIIRGE